MMPRLVPKHRGTAYAACVLLIATAAVVMGFKPVSRFPAPRLSGVAMPDDPETLRATQAVEELKRLAELERFQSPAQAAGSDRILALYSPELAASTPSALAALDFSKTSLVILETRRGTFAVIDGVGVGVRPGHRLPSGEIVRRVGKTFIVIEDSTGAARRIDLKDSFGTTPTPAAAPATTAPGEIPAPAPRVAPNPLLTSPPASPALPLFPAATQKK